MVATLVFFAAFTLWLVWEFYQNRRCPDCKSYQTSYVNKTDQGTIFSLNGSTNRTVRRYVCKKCGRRFSIVNEFNRNRLNNP